MHIKKDTLVLCNNIDVNNKAVLDLLEDLKWELVNAVEQNSIKDLDVTTLGMRQEQALSNWVHDTVEKRLDLIAENN